jgi:hypothetical protein
MTKWSGLGDSTELSRVRLSQPPPPARPHFHQHHQHDAATNTPPPQPPPRWRCHHACRHHHTAPRTTRITRINNDILTTTFDLWSSVYVLSRFQRKMVWSDDHTTSGRYFPVLSSLIPYPNYKVSFYRVNRCIPDYRSIVLAVAWYGSPITASLYPSDFSPLSSFQEDLFPIPDLTPRSTLATTTYLPARVDRWTTRSPSRSLELQSAQDPSLLLGESLISGECIFFYKERYTNLTLPNDLVFLATETTGNQNKLFSTHLWMECVVEVIIAIRKLD